VDRDHRQGGFDLGAERWHWDVSYSPPTTTRAVVDEPQGRGIRWILAGASSVVADPNQKDTYIVDGDFYDNQLVGNIVRPVQRSEIGGLVGENVLRANSSSNFLTLTVDGTLGDLGVFYQPVKFALRSGIAEQSMEIIPDARSLNTTGEGWYNIGAIAADGDRDRKALALELAVPVVSRLDLSLAARVDHYSDASDISGRLSGQIKFLYRATDWLKLRGGYSQTFRAPDMFNIYGQSDAYSTIADFSAPGCFDGQTYVCGQHGRHDAAPDTGLTEARRRPRLRHLAAGHELHADRRLVPDRAAGPRGHRTAYDTLLRSGSATTACWTVRRSWPRRPQPHHAQRLRRDRARHDPADQPGQRRARASTCAPRSRTSRSDWVRSRPTSASRRCWYDLNRFAGDER
jgi:hypothetical protein